MVDIDDFNRFNEMVSNDYQTHFSYLIEETDSVMIVSEERNYCNTIRYGRYRQLIPYRGRRRQDIFHRSIQKNR
jgi:hypothetical protein